MKRSFLLYLSLCLGIGTLSAEGVGTRHVVDCGTWMELTATPAEDYHFVRWNDGNTDSIRQIQVNENAHYIAFFAANCEEYANWPVVSLYDWLLMLNITAINAMGYYVQPDQVKWYRIVGEADDMHSRFPQDDRFVCTGHYLTLDKNLIGTGDYYAVADVSDAQGMLCDGLMRSEIVHYAASASAPSVRLLPNNVLQGETIRLVGLSEDEPSHIAVYSASGQLIEEYHFMGQSEVTITAVSVSGCYLVRVTTGMETTTLRYIVNLR